MVARTFVVARGRINELAERVIQNDPAASILFIAYYQGTIEVDATLEAHLTKSAVDAGQTICDFTNYSLDTSRALANIVRTIASTEQFITSDNLVISLAGGAVNNTITRAMLYYDDGSGTITSGNAHASIAGAPAGTVVPGVATQNWEVDVTIDGGSLQQLAIAVNILDDYDTIAATLSTAITGGTCAFVSGDFVVTSTLTGIESTVIVAAGTLGVTSDLFAAITAAAAGNPAITFPAPTAGSDGTESAVPLAHYQFDVTTSGIDTTFEPGASGLYRTG